MSDITVPLREAVRMRMRILAKDGAAYLKKIVTQRKAKKVKRTVVVVEDGKQKTKNIWVMQGAPPGKPPAMRTGTLAAHTGFSVVKNIKSVKAIIYSSAVTGDKPKGKGSKPYPLFLEVGAGFGGAHPHLEPTIRHMAQKSREIMGRPLSSMTIQRLAGKMRSEFPSEARTIIRVG